MDPQPRVIVSETGPVSIRQQLSDCLPPPFGAIAAANEGAPFELSEPQDRVDAVWESLLRSQPASGYWRARDSHHPYFITAAVLQQAIRSVGQELARLVEAVIAAAGDREPPQRVLCAGGWGQHPAVVRLLDEKVTALSRATSTSAAPPGAAALGALGWHLRGHSHLRAATDGTIGIRVQGEQGATRVQPLIAPGVALPARTEFPLFARAGQRRFALEFAKDDGASGVQSLGFFTADYPTDLPKNHRLDCTLEVARDGTLRVLARDTGGERHAILAAPEIEDASGFERQRQWVARVGVNEPADNRPG
jgi:hypothetical protein